MHTSYEFSLLDGAVDRVYVRDLAVPRVDLAIIEGPDSHDDADIVVALPVRVRDGVRRHPRGVGVKSERREWTECVCKSKLTN